jgi:DNA replicative helicase MCM subunit Mcm2 (Cdc46/Mcm family)
MCENMNTKELPKELCEYFQKISENDPINYLSKMIAPHLVGTEWETIRKTTLLSLASYGLQKAKKKTRLHSLLLGKPGTGKTEVLIWIQDNIQNSIMINSENTSKTGLVGDARGSEITAGLLAQYDGNFVLLDELDKMSTTDQNGLLQAMEEGSYKIIKGKHREKFQAEIRVIASANIFEKIQPPLVDRFDFIYICSTSTREERAKNVPRITESFFGGNDEKNAQILNGYMEWLGDITPSSFENKKIIDTYIANYIKKVQEVDVIRASYRFLEMSIIRIAWAIAKLHKREVITPQDITNAIIFKHDTMRRIYGINIKKEGRK